MTQPTFKVNILKCVICSKTITQINSTNYYCSVCDILIKNLQDKNFSKNNYQIDLNNHGINTYTTFRTPDSFQFIINGNIKYVNIQNPTIEKIINAYNKEIQINYFSNINSEYSELIQQVLKKYNVICRDIDKSNKNDELGFYIRNGIINLVLSGVSIQHELAHIVLINNFKKLLIDNWGMSGDLYKHKPELIEKWLLNTESKVWGIENFLTSQKYKRDLNISWIIFKENNNKIKLLVNEIMDKYEKSMTIEVFIKRLIERLDFIQNHINQNPGFNSKHFPLFD